MAGAAATCAKRRRSLWAVGVAIVFCASLAGLWLFLGVRPEPHSERAGAVASARQWRDVAQEPLASAQAEPATPDDAAWRPAEVIGNLECDMLAGRRAAAGSALVILPHGTGARFAVLDGDGVVARGTLPFKPNQYRLGRRRDGTPLVALGELRLNAKVFRPEDTPEPVRVYLGDDVIYESDKVWDVVVAHDGSSFAVHEPLGDVSRLAIHNLALGTQSHFELEFGSVDAYEHSHAPKYTLDGTEVMLEPVHADAWGVGVYWFHPVDEGPVRRVTVEGGIGAVLASSGEGYFADQPDDLRPDEYPSVWQVTKRRFDTATGAIEDVWKRRLELRHFDGHLSLSDDGRWLGVHGWNFHALSTGSGGTVFRYPTVGHLEERVARLGDAAGEGASAADLGSISDIHFMGGNLLFFRQFGRGGGPSCYTPTGEGHDELRIRKCLREERLRGLSKAPVYDVYDMNGITLDARPAYRAEVYFETRCMAGNVPFRGLQDVDGELVYLRDVRSG